MTISKKELAKAYNISIVTLHKWITPFSEELEKTGYDKNQKYFTPKQKKIIVEKLGSYDTSI